VPTSSFFSSQHPFWPPEAGPPPSPPGVDKKGPVQGVHSMDASVPCAATVRPGCILTWTTLTH